MYIVVIHEKMLMQNIHLLALWSWKNKTQVTLFFFPFFNSTILFCFVLLIPISVFSVFKS